ncbi:hypothetical protein B0T11DRAFT_321810, partial [Plectosphaerella cucumerina]
PLSPASRTGRVASSSCLLLLASLACPVPSLLCPCSHSIPFLDPVTLNTNPRPRRAGNRTRCTTQTNPASPRRLADILSFVARLLRSPAFSWPDDSIASCCTR